MLSVLDNWKPLQELRDESLDTKLDPEMKSRIIGIKHQMETFNYFFGVSLASLIFGHSDNLSKTLQHSYISAVEGQFVAKMSAVKTLQTMRSDLQFDLFWAKIIHIASEFNIDKPLLPRKRKRPSRYELGSAEPTFPETIEEHYRQIYFNSLDCTVACIEFRFSQPGYKVYSQMESLLVNAANSKDFSKQFDAVCFFLGDGTDKMLLQIQLQTFSTFPNIHQWL